MATRVNHQEAEQVAELLEALKSAQNLLKAVHHWRNSMMAADPEIHEEISRVIANAEAINA